MNPAGAREWWLGLTSDEVWATLQADPDFREGMARAAAEHEAGLFTPFRHYRGQPADEQTHDELHEAIHNTCTKPIHEGEP